ncbi:hypothetical protein QNH47_13410 [Virgibacillus halodenitrificans]|uniref:hypothetical protein n=1 Tax=Virgibacillus halodenitrificans TaxID=1482 RepID=UPI0024C0252E|nr:hypothetical protein [Virgibacillus halodenitrificans]WHX25154.1 hypothetical protein QNH47_13410 [Virgibacillus halodenitrificans]
MKLYILLVDSIFLFDKQEPLAQLVEQRAIHLPNKLRSNPDAQDFFEQAIRSRGYT